jgi:hypothetical protein
LQKQPYKPDLPRPVAVVKGSTWADIWNGIATLSKQNQNLVQYLQNYLTNLFKWIVPAKYIVTIVDGGSLPYTVNATDAFVAGPAGTYTLPPASGSGRVIIVKNVDTTGGVVMVVPQGTDTIDGGGETDITLANNAIRLIDGAPGQWMIW